jgi:peptidoglycan hydrolase-like protein with peptidoglycan-binding domain
MKSSQTGGATMGGGNSEQVKAVQQALKDKGHDPGDIDGVMGPKTQAALRDYQQKEGLKATGRLDAETSAKLGVEGGKTSSASPSSPAASPSTGSSSSDSKSKGGKTSMKSDSGMKSGTSSDSSANSSSSAKQPK